MIIADRISMFEQYAREHKMVLHEHNTSDPAAPLRRSFIPITAEDGLESAVKNKAHFPAVVMIDKIYGRIVDKQKSYRREISNTLWFLDKIAETTTNFPHQSKMEALERAERVMNDFISRLLHEYEEQGGCGVFKRLDPARFVFEQTDVISDNLIGWKLRFSDEITANPLLTYVGGSWGSPNNSPASGSSGSSSAPGTITTLDADTAGAVEPNPTGKFYTLNMFNVGSSTISIFNDKPQVVDWGDGSPLKRYPGGSIVVKAYSINNDPIEMKVYWEVNTPNSAKELFIGSGGLNNQLVVDTITGDFHPQLQRFQIGSGLNYIPYSMLPTTLKFFKLRGCVLTAEQLDELVAWCDTNGHSRGTIDVMNTGGASPDSLLAPFERLRDDKNWKLWIDL